MTVLKYLVPMLIGLAVDKKVNNKAIFRQLHACITCPLGHLVVNRLPLNIFMPFKYIIHTSAYNRWR